MAMRLHWVLGPVLAASVAGCDLYRNDCVRHEYATVATDLCARDKNGRCVSYNPPTQRSLLCAEMRCKDGYNHGPGVVNRNPFAPWKDGCLTKEEAERRKG